MADFKSASLWMKLALLVTTVSFVQLMVAFDMPGWASTSTDLTCDVNGNCTSAYLGVEICMVVAFVVAVTTLILVLCLVFLDELKGSKAAKIAFIVLAFVAGFCVLAGVVIYLIQTSNTGSNNFSVSVTFFVAVELVAAGVFGVLDLVKGAKKGGGGGKK